MKHKPTFFYSGRSKLSFVMIMLLILLCLSTTAYAVTIIINGYYERVAQMDADGSLMEWQLEDKISFVNVMREYVSCALRGLLRTASAIGQAPSPKIQRSPGSRRKGGHVGFFHCPIKIISRNKGRSAVAASAYISATWLENTWEGTTHDYTRKQHVIYTEVMLPAHVPSEYADRSVLWNSVEWNEKSAMPSLLERWSWRYQRSLPTIRTSQ